MKRAFVILLIILAILIYRQYYGTPSNTISADENAPKAPSVRLAPYVEASKNTFAQLGGSVPPTPASISAPRQEIQSLETEFRGAWQNAPASDRPVYQNAVAVCEALVTGLDARNKYLARLEALHGNPNSVTLAEDKLKEGAQRREFFDNALERRWEAAAQPLRENVQTSHANLLQAESRSSFAPKDLASNITEAVKSFFNK